MLATLTYLDIFDEPVPSVDELLSGISSESALALLSIINAQLYLDRSFEKQMAILSELLDDTTSPTRDHIFNKLAAFQATHPILDYAFFSITYCLEFIHHELLNYRQGRTISSAQDRISFFKAYLVISEKVGERHIALSNDVVTGKVDLFRGQMWPLLLRQFTLENRVNPVAEIPKGIAMLNYFESHEKYKLFYQRFLEKVDKRTSWNFIMDLVLLFAQGSQMYERNKKTGYPWIINDSKGFASLFSLLTIDVEVYKKDKSLHRAYIGLLQKPLIRLNGSVHVLNWNFVVSKIHESLVFDFYRLSGISELPEFKEFGDFKSHVSHKIVEQQLFRRIIGSIFNRRGDTVLFDDSNASAFPDAYIRSGKNIFLFEVKDALFSAGPIQDPSFRTITEEVDRKFNTPKKGIGQLYKHIAHLGHGKFETRTFEELRLKRRNLVIYPILVYTDAHFGLPGIGQYLASKFQSKLAANPVSGFQLIKPLSMISLSFFMDNIDLINRKLSLKNIIDLYIASSRNRKDSKPNPNPLENATLNNQTIEQYFKIRHRKKMPAQYRAYMERIVSALKLT